ncbi:Uma2 family endonuclease [bacterium]|nr:Uma2 family endonuclease [bacterium]
MGLPESQTDQRFTYGDYVKWPADERWELIEGRAVAMTPAPTVRHQEVLMALAALLWQYFEGKTCRALAAPTDVRLPDANEKDESIETVVQPDLLVVCDPKKLDEKGVRGAPDLIIEILAESTAARDLGEKLRLYEKHAVRCYIIADPWGKTLTVRYYEETKFGTPELFAAKTKMPVRLFEGLTLDLERVYGGV